MFFYSDRNKINKIFANFKSISICIIYFSTVNIRDIKEVRKGKVGFSINFQISKSIKSIHTITKFKIIFIKLNFSTNTQISHDFERWLEEVGKLDIKQCFSIHFGNKFVLKSLSLHGWFYGATYLCKIKNEIIKLKNKAMMINSSQSTCQPSLIAC